MLLLRGIDVWQIDCLNEKKIYLWTVLDSYPKAELPPMSHRMYLLDYAKVRNPFGPILFFIRGFQKTESRSVHGATVNRRLVDPANSALINSMRFTTQFLLIVKNMICFYAVTTLRRRHQTNPLSPFALPAFFSKPDTAEGRPWRREARDLPSRGGERRHCRRHPSKAQAPKQSSRTPLRG